MASASHAMLSTSTYAFTSPRLFRKFRNRQNYGCFTVIRASSDDPDCNTEECAPDKEVGKVSMEWLAGEKTKVVGTFPPRSRGWTGYVEKDTAGQTNIYSVEPAVYVAENAIASGTAGSSSSGAENTVAIASGLALVSIAAASLILLQVGKNSPEIQTVDYNGPSLSYYISKFKPQEIVQVSVPSGTEPSPSVRAEAFAAKVTQIDISSISTSRGAMHFNRDICFLGGLDQFRFLEP